MRKLIQLLFLVISAYSGYSQDKKHDFKIEKDLVWASPDGFDLTMDIYTPQTGRKKYPVLVIFHGGAWMINTKSIMDQMSAYVAGNGEYVVCNVNYRLLGDQGNTVTVDQIVEDVMGAVLWVKTNISKYAGDPKNVAVTGDSAGGHLSEMILVARDKLCSEGFDSGNSCFEPSYLPTGKTAEKIAKKDGLNVQAAVISYGAFDIYAAAMGGFEKSDNFFWSFAQTQPRGIMGKEYNAENHGDRYKAVSPAYLLKTSADMQLPPQFFHVGSMDQTTTPASIEKYYNDVIAKGHKAEFWLYEGRNHAYLDSGTNEFLGLTFEKDAIEPLNRIIAFLDSVFY